MKNNQELISILKDRESQLYKMRDVLKKKDQTIQSYTQKDMTLQILNIKVEEINGFFTQLLKKVNKQHEKEKEIFKKQIATASVKAN